MGGLDLDCIKNSLYVSSAVTWNFFTKTLRTCFTTKMVQWIAAIFGVFMFYGFFMVNRVRIN